MDESKPTPPKEGIAAAPSSRYAVKTPAKRALARKDSNGDTFRATLPNEVVTRGPSSRRTPTTGSAWCPPKRHHRPQITSPNQAITLANNSHRATHQTAVQKITSVSQLHQLIMENPSRLSGPSPALPFRPSPAITQNSLPGTQASMLAYASGLVHIHPTRSSKHM